MLGLLLVSGFLTGVSPWRQPLEWKEVPLNESCREQALQHVGTAVLHLLRLAHPPRFPADATSQVHEAWAKELEEVPSFSSWGQHLNASFNQTLVIRRGLCTQVSHRVTVADLGWQRWVMQPKAFIFTECLGCPCPGKEERPPLWIQGCQLGAPGNQPDPDTKQRRCCRPRHAPLAFMFLDENGSMVIRSIDLVHACRCHP